MKRCCSMSSRNANLLVLQAACEAIRAAPYEERFKKVAEQMPIPAYGNKTVAELATGNTSSPLPPDSGNTSSPVLPGAAAALAPNSADAESGTTMDDSLFPGALRS
jgi:hypothetical protein